MNGHARAEQHKPSGIAAKERIIRVHLTPLLGAMRLDAITNEDVQRLKGHLQHRAPKTVNNVLNVISMMLKKALEWGVIAQMPCTIRQLRTSPPTMDFYDFEEYESWSRRRRPPIHARTSWCYSAGKRGCGWER